MVSNEEQYRSLWEQVGQYASSDLAVKGLVTPEDTERLSEYERMPKLVTWRRAGSLATGSIVYVNYGPEGAQQSPFVTRISSASGGLRVEHGVARLGDPIRSEDDTTMHEAAVQIAEPLTEVPVEVHAVALDMLLDSVARFQLSGS